MIDLPGHTAEHLYVPFTFAVFLSAGLAGVIVWLVLATASDSSLSASWKL